MAQATAFWWCPEDLRDLGRTIGPHLAFLRNLSSKTQPKSAQSRTRLSHFDEAGQAGMVDVSAKQSTRRTATASAFVELSPAVLAALPANPKGNPLEVARIAGIQAAKRTSELIPMCHPLALTHVDVQAEIVARRRADYCNCCNRRTYRRGDGGAYGGCRRCADRL